MLPTPPRFARFAAGLAWLTVTAAAQTNLTVINPGFEDISGESTYNEFTFGPLNG